MNYPYYQPYQMGYSQPVPDQLTMLRQNQYQQPMQQAPQQGNNGINWCQGESGAKSYMVAPGNQVLLMDSEACSFYIKSTDASGMPLPLRIFDYTERAAAPRSPQHQVNEHAVEYVTREEFNQLVERLESQATPKKKTVTKEDTQDVKSNL